MKTINEDTLNFDVPTLDDELERAKKEFAQSFKPEDLLTDPEFVICDDLSSPIVVKKKTKYKIHNFLSRLKYVLGM